MKRIATLAAGLALLGTLVVASPARADFHLQTQACANAVGVALVSLTESAGTFTFNGTIYCDGATSVNITALTFAPVPSNGVVVGGRQLTPPPPAVAGTTPGCAPCGPAPTTGTGTAPSSPGLYVVRMDFTAVGPGGTFMTFRKAGFAWSGA